MTKTNRHTTNHPGANAKTRILKHDVADVIVARHCNGLTYAYHVGAHVGVTSYVAAPEGGHMQTYDYGTLVELGRGTECGMLGDDTALARVTIAGKGDRVIPLRLLDVYDTGDDEINPNDAESARRDRGLPARDGTVRS